MTMLTLNNRIFVPVPMSAEVTQWNESMLLIKQPGAIYQDPYRLPFPAKIVADTKYISEEVARTIMPVVDIPPMLDYKYYMDFLTPISTYDLALDSLQSFLTSHSIERAIILEKI